jgi:hypothetical protein
MAYFELDFFERLRPKPAALVADDVTENRKRYPVRSQSDRTSPQTGLSWSCALRLVHHQGIV